MKKHFCKHLIVCAKENENFEMTNICWICGGFIDPRDNNVTDHCHITSK